MRTGAGRAWPVVVLLLLGTLPPASGTSQGLALSPPALDLTAPPLFPGSERIARMTVFNSGSLEADVVSAGAEPAGQWISPIPAKFHLGVGGSQEVTLHIQVPAGTASGRYTGRIDFQPTLAGGDGSQIVSGVSGLLNFSVESTMVHDLVIRAMNVTSIHAGEDLPLHVALHNAGNVADGYHLELTVLDVDRSRTLVATGFDAAALTAGDDRADTYHARLALASGQYAYTLKATLAGSAQVLQAQDGLFQVMAPGEHPGTGSLAFLGVTPPAVQAREEVQVKAEFHSGGAAAVLSARLVAKVLRDGVEVASIASPVSELPRGGDATLTASYVPTSPGAHTVRGYVLYDGLRTETRDAPFEATGTHTGFWGFIPGVLRLHVPDTWWTLATPLGLVLLLIGLLGLLALWRRTERRREKAKAGLAPDEPIAVAPGAGQPAGEAADVTGPSPSADMSDPPVPVQSMPPLQPGKPEAQGPPPQSEGDGPAWLRARGGISGGRRRGPAWSAFRPAASAGQANRAPRLSRRTRVFHRLWTIVRHPMATLFHR